MGFFSLYKGMDFGEIKVHKMWGNYKFWINGHSGILIVLHHKAQIIPFFS